MNKIVYSTDTTHCEGNFCKKKYDCLRHMMHRMKNQRPRGAVLIPYIVDEFKCINNNYENFKPF